MMDKEKIEYRELIARIVDDVREAFPKSGTLPQMLQATDHAVQRALGRFSSPAEFFIEFPEVSGRRIGNRTRFEIGDFDTIEDALRLLAEDAIETSMSFETDELLWQSFPEGIYKAVRGVLDVAIRYHNRGLAGGVDKQEIKDTRDLFVSDGVVGPEFWSVVRMVHQVTTNLLHSGRPQPDAEHQTDGTVVSETLSAIGGERAAVERQDDAAKIIHLISAQESRFKAQLRNAWAEFDAREELGSMRRPS